MKKTILFISFLLCGHHLFAQTITGTTSVCRGSITTLSNSSAGGVWTSGTMATATVDSFSGDVSGVSAGTSVITYYYAGGGYTTATVTVNPLPAAITGTGNACQGANSPFGDATTGGTWSSSNNSVAMIDGSTGIATGISSDTATIMYTLTTGCASHAGITVNPMPLPITGSSNHCVGVTDTLYDFGAGTWTTSTTGIIALGATAGDITGIASGTADVTYTLPSGCAVDMTVYVNPQPNAGNLTAASIICMGNTANAASDACCGTWSSSNPAIASVGPVSGIITGLAAGIVAINYSVTNLCGTAIAIAAVRILSTEACGNLGVSATVTAPVTLSVLPNPAKDGKMVVILNSDKDEQASIIITNVLGEKIKEFTTATNQSNDVKIDSAAGIYYISATTPHGRYDSKIVVE